MIAFVAAASSGLLRPITRQAEEAFWAYPHVFMAFMSVGLAALLISTFWILRGAGKATSATRQALRAQSLKRQKDHRAMVLVANIDGGGGARLREHLMAAIETHFGAFAFAAPIQVEPFPARFKIIAAKAHPEKIRRVAVQAADVLDRSAGDVIVWGRRGVGDKVELRMVTAQSYSRSLETHVMEFKLKSLSIMRSLCDRPIGKYRAPGEALTLGAPDLPVADFKVELSEWQKTNKIVSWSYPYDKLSTKNGPAQDILNCTNNDADARASIMDGLHIKRFFDCKRGIVGWYLRWNAEPEKLMEQHFVKTHTEDALVFLKVCRAVTHDEPYQPK